MSKMYFLAASTSDKFVNLIHILQSHLLPLRYIPGLSQISFIILIVLFHSIPYNVG